MNNIADLNVPVTKTIEVDVEKTVDGVPTVSKQYKQVTEMEPINIGGKQSDGSQWSFPTKLVADDHEHYMVKKSATSRQVVCECGFGGDIYPHNSVLKDGHVFTLDGRQVA